MESNMKHLSNWIEIPVRDMARARRFYERILQVELQPMDVGPVEYALFPSEDRYNCGALARGDGYEPGPGGVTVYLDGGGDLDGIVDRVAGAGGTILMPKTYMGQEAGHVAMFLDSEGNRVGLQTP